VSKELYFCQVVLAEAVEHACMITCPGHVPAALFPGQWGRAGPPRPSGSSVLNSQGSDKSCLLPGGPTSDIAQRRSHRECSQPSSERERENQVCVYRNEYRASLQSIRTLIPGSSVIMSTSCLMRKEEWKEIWVSCLSAS